MILYANFGATTDKLLTKFGQSLIITHIANGAYDPETGMAATTTTTQNAIGAIFDYGTKDIDGTLIKSGDKKLLLSPAGITIPTVGDSVTIGAAVSKITMIKEVSPAGTPVLYQANLRA